MILNKTIYPVLLWPFNYGTFKVQNKQVQMKSRGQLLSGFTSCPSDFARDSFFFVSIFFSIHDGAGGLATRLLKYI